MNNLTRILGAWLLLGTVAPAGATIISYTLSAQQGFSFDAASQAKCGYITSMSIGSTALAADLQVTDPTNTAGRINVVAVLTSVTWGGSAGDSISFNARVSPSNQQALTLLVSHLAQNEQTAPPVTFRFEVIDYDQTTQTYFESFEGTGNATLNGFVALTGGSDNLLVASSAETDIVSPKNYDFQVALAPTASQQDLTYAGTPTTPIVKVWGIALGPVPPMANTLAAGQISTTAATLKSSVNPGNVNTSVFFEYGTSSTLATKSYSTTNGVGSGSSGVSDNFSLPGLSPQSTYYYRVIAVNSQGRTPGNILPLTTVTPQFSLSNPVTTGGAFKFSFANASNGLFSVHASTNLSVAVSNWPSIGAPTEIAPGEYQFSTSTTNPSAFFILTSP